LESRIGPIQEHAPTVTVLMPVYNAAPYLDEAIASITGQTFADFEFLIVNDDSTDGSDTIVRKHAGRDSRIRLLNNRRTKGVAGALNTGLEEARGRYIARMDADDVSFPRRLEKQVRFMEEHPEVGISGTWKEVIGEGQGRLWFPYLSDPEQIKVSLLFYCPVGSPVAIMRRALLEKHNLYYDENVGFIEDWDMYERAAMCFPLSNLTEVLLYYRIHGANVSTVKSERELRSEWAIKARQIERLGLFPTDEEKEVHNRVFFGPYEGPGLVHRAEAWLSKLARANRRKHVYRTRSFEREMRRLYFNACIRVRGLRPATVPGLFLSRLCLSFPPSPGELIGLGSRYFRSLCKAG